jgi:diacylglycerol kinase
MDNKQSILSSFKHGFNGMVYFFLHERNGQVQIAVAATVVVLAVCLGVSATEWLALLLCITLVLSLEMMNSATEKLCDLVQEEYHPIIKIVKDVAAGSVLLTAIFSLIIGCIVLLPKLIQLLW